MYIYESIIVILVLIILGMAWKWYSVSKKENKTFSNTVSALKEDFPTTYHTLIDNVSEHENSYDICKTLLEYIVNVDEENRKHEEELNALQLSEKKLIVGLEQKSHEIVHISHQMRTSLSGLLGFTQFLQSTTLNDEQKEFTSIIATSSQELLTLVNGIIDMSPANMESIQKNLDEHTQDTGNEKQNSKNIIPNILIVDDNEINKKLLAKVLENENLNVTYASDGQEAVTLREENSYDMIFMDIQMPVMNGVDASKAIRRYEQEEQLSAVPIVALTANTGKDDRNEYLDAGMTDYMAKPIMIEDIREKIAQL